MNLVACAFLLVGFFSGDNAEDGGDTWDLSKVEGYDLDNVAEAKNAVKAGINQEKPHLLWSALNALDSMDELDSFAEEVLKLADGSSSIAVHDHIYEGISVIGRIMKSRLGCEIFRYAVDRIEKGGWKEMGLRVIVRNAYRAGGYPVDNLQRQINAISTAEQRSKENGQGDAADEMCRQIHANLEDFCDRFGYLEPEPYSGISSSMKPRLKGRGPII
ncbi:MAG: hypothetical protein GX580_00250 [Candidatus Hydrogenedens sp.]|nr:hypothetical protein [Candidatus Hydrogenedentota bacterium]NLF56050.1 hypothetical protein [Candidatus Hydrogenedens sp.]